MNLRVIKRGFKYLRRTRDFKSVFDYLLMEKNLSNILDVKKQKISELINEFSETGLISYIDKKTWDRRKSYRCIT